VDLVQVGKHGESGLVSKGNVDETVVHERAHASNSSGLLSAAEGTGGDENTGVLAPEATLLPLLAGLVPEGLELCGEVAYTMVLGLVMVCGVCEVAAYRNVWGYRRGCRRIPRGWRVLLGRGRRRP
jgi:hypothetical protein